MESKKGLRNRRGYFFVIDAFIGGTIIIIALMLIITSEQRVPRVASKFATTEELSAFMITARIEDTNNYYIANWTREGIITNPRQTIMEQVTEFYYKNDTTRARLLVESIVNGTLPAKNGCAYTIDNTTIYSRGMGQYNESSLIIATKKVVYWQANSTTLYGPSITEIKVWT